MIDIIGKLSKTGSVRPDQEEVPPFAPRDKSDPPAIRGDIGVPRLLQTLRERDGLSYWTCPQI